MPSVLHVAIWSVNTLDQNPGSWIHKAYGERVSELNQALAVFFRFRMTNNNVATSHEADVVRAIFVAPEYFFASVVEQDGYLNRDYVSEGTMSALKRDIPGPVNTLLVPGSTATTRARSSTPRTSINTQASRSRERTPRSSSSIRSSSATRSTSTPSRWRDHGTYRRVGIPSVVLMDSSASNRVSRRPSAVVRSHASHNIDT